MSSDLDCNQIHNCPSESTNVNETPPKISVRKTTIRLKCKRENCHRKIKILLKKKDPNYKLEFNINRGEYFMQCIITCKNVGAGTSSTCIDCVLKNSFDQGEDETKKKLVLVEECFFPIQTIKKYTCTICMKGKKGSYFFAHEQKSGVREVVKTDTHAVVS